jgi:DNA polymerase elongation subunit (family B)
MCKNKKPVVLYWDIETAMMQLGAFSLRNNDYINPMNITQDWFIIMASFMNLGTGKIRTVSVADKKWRFKKDFTDDYYVVKTMRDIIASADIIIGHNSDKFDLKKLNARIIFHGLEPLPPVTTIDTLKEARKIASFSSNTMSYLAEYLGLEHQKGSASGAWHKILKGSQEERLAAVKEMEAYCEQDIRTGVALYERLKPYFKTHPNMGLYEEYDTDTAICPSCSSDNLQRRGYRRTRTRVYARLQCQDCGFWSTARKSETDLVHNPIVQ